MISIVGNQHSAIGALRQCGIDREFLSCRNCVGGREGVFMGEGDFQINVIDFGSGHFGVRVSLHPSVALEVRFANCYCSRVGGKG